jgi:hypothetical protein
MRKFGQVLLGNKRKGGTKNLKDFESIDVDRENPVLGNKEILWDHRDDTERARVIEAYRVEYEADWQVDGPMKQETLKLARKAYKGQNLLLLCWCSGAPTYKSCHAELIKSRIEEILAPYAK